MKELQSALKMRPRWPDFLLQRAQVLDLWLGQREGDKRQAVDQALGVNPKHPDGLFMRGMSQLSDGAWAAARQTFEAGLAARPHHLRSLAGLAAAAWLTGDEEAFARQEKAIFDRDPTYGSVYRIVAEALNIPFGPMICGAMIQPTRSITVR